MKMAGLALLCFAASGCIQEGGYERDQKVLDNAIIAEIEQIPATRVSIDSETPETGGTILYFWNPEDEIGVFTAAGETNLQYYNLESEDSKSVAFIPADDVIGTPTIAYYP